MQTGLDPQSQQLQRWVKPFVTAFLAVFLITAVFQLDTWPFTGWRLFSKSRTAVYSGLEPYVVDKNSGREVKLNFSQLPKPYRNYKHVLAELNTLDPVEADAVCRAWLKAWQQKIHQFEPSGIVIYRRRLDFSKRNGDRSLPAVIDRSSNYRCADGKGVLRVEAE